MEKEIRILEIYDFDELKKSSWSGALQTLDAIEEKGIESEFIDFLNDIITCNAHDKIYWTDVELNDFIWFDTDYIEECLDVKLWD